MGLVFGRMLDDKTRDEKIQKLTEMLDSECLEVLHKNMLPEEVALFVVLQKKYEKQITFRAGFSNWTLKKGTFTSEFTKRREELLEKNTQETNIENHIKKAKDGFCKLDAAIFLDDENENASEDENEAKITSYFKEQVTAAISISTHRIEELKKQHGAPALPSASKKAIEEHERKHFEKLDRLKNTFFEDIKHSLNEEREKLSDILRKYHNKQLDILREMDADITKEIRNQSSPSPAVLLAKVKKDDDPDLNVKSQELIVDLTNHINKVDLKDEDIKNYFGQKNSEFREPAVCVDLQHRDIKDGRYEDIHALVENVKGQRVNADSILREGYNARDKHSEVRAKCASTMIEGEENA
ncbi:uncharacterized protein LOC111107517 [Crassostrea virginica]